MNEINELATSGAPNHRAAELAANPTSASGRAAELAANPASVSGRAAELAANLASVRERVAEACRRSGRDPEEVTIVAVSKTKPEEDIMDLYRAGQRDFGENYVQELREKEEHLPKDIRWHMIGHLQRNKVKYIAGYVAMIHSVDSARLAQEIEKEAARHDRVIPVLIEVNVAGEDTKFGVSPEDLPELCAFIRTLPHVQLRGLMTSAPLTDNPEEDRPVFRKMSQLSVDMNSENDNNKMNGVIRETDFSDVSTAVDSLRPANEVSNDPDRDDLGRIGKRNGILSMGMSGDFEIAVEEGSNCVRIGTTIFGARQYGPD